MRVVFLDLAIVIIGINHAKAIASTIINAAITELFIFKNYFLVNVLSKSIIPKENSPSPNSKQIVLVGYPVFVIQAYAFNNEPEIIELNKSNILFLFAID